MYNSYNHENHAEWQPLIQNNPLSKYVGLVAKNYIIDNILIFLNSSVLLICF